MINQSGPDCFKQGHIVIYNDLQSDASAVCVVLPRAKLLQMHQSTVMVVLPSKTSPYDIGDIITLNNSQIHLIPGFPPSRQA